MATRHIKAVGILFFSVSTNRYLYLMRNDAKHMGNWGLPGGKIEKSETILDAINRECIEEIGFVPDFIKLMPIEKFTSPDGRFTYHTFFCSVSEEFVPTLNHEHIGWAWVQSGHSPRPMHPGLWSTVNIEAVQEKVRVIEQNISAL